MNRLVPNTGIQYLALSPVPLDRFRKHDFRLRRGPQFHQVMPFVAGGSRTDDSGDDFSPQSAMRSRSADLAVIDQLMGIRPEGLWLPVPYEGGALWVAVFLRKCIGPEGRHQVEATLAVETTLEGDGNVDGVSVEELGARSPSPCAIRFWRHPAVRTWLNQLALELPDGARRSEQSLEELQIAVAGLADLLARSQESTVTLEARPTVQDGIVVDVMLDLGNSRTCVLLEERMAGGRRQRLELLYPDNPRRTEASPFLTQSALFEHQIVPRMPLGGTVSFRHLSMLKLGSAALDALAARDADPRPLGLSTPKRYLWEDYGRVDWTWRFANRLDAERMCPPIEGDLVRRMDPGSIFRAPDFLDLAQPDHPRLACMAWTIVELLEQAFRQVNSPQWRGVEAQAPNHPRRRTIGSLVLVYPAGLHSEEIENYREAAKFACKNWSHFRSSPSEYCEHAGAVAVDDRHGVPAPRVQLVCDEGMAIQLCWLYGESVHRFAARPSLLVESLGRPRAGVPTLRLASIDIGGGTVDLAIADYSVNKDLHATVAFDCKPQFHDSISRAGDDILRGILEDHVFPTIRREFGCTATAWNRVFASSMGIDDEVRELRRRLVRGLWVPVAMALLERIEATATAEGGQDAEVAVRLGAECRSSLLLDQLSKVLRSGAPAPDGATSLQDVEVRLTREDMRGVVRGTIGRTIDQCSDIIDQFDCDLLVVGGRPSGNPEVREQIYASMAVPPGQVVFLSELAVDDWYPFADGSGRIGDAKTCGAVGAAVAFCGRYGHPALGAFFLRFVDGKEQALQFGFMQNVAAVPVFDSGNVIDPDGRRRISFKPTQPLVVACRRVDDDRAEARPIYRLGLKRSVQAELQRDPVIQENVEVVFEWALDERARPRDDGAEIKVRPRDDDADIQVRLPKDRLVEREVSGIVRRPTLSKQVEPVDAGRVIELRLCTLADSGGYWIDTGEFRAQDGIDA
jgi:hypothetical protein